MGVIAPHEYTTYFQYSPNLVHRYCMLLYEVVFYCVPLCWAIISQRCR